jgi:hypothetical protein
MKYKGKEFDGQAYMIQVAPKARITRSNPPNGAIQAHTELPRRGEEGVLGPEFPPSIQLCT